MTADAGLIVAGSGNAVNADLPPSVDMTHAGEGCQSVPGVSRISANDARPPMTSRPTTARKHGNDTSRGYHSGSKTFEFYAVGATERPAPREGKTLTTTETWADIPEFEGRYQASNLGNVRSLDRYDKNGRFWPGRPLKQHNTRGGYKAVSLGRGHQFRVNRLVLMAFEGNQPDMQAAHENGINTDNRLTNLSWKTPLENNQDKYRHGTVWKSHCKRGHPLTDDNIVPSELEKGIRRCLPCELVRREAFNEKRRATSRSKATRAPNDIDLPTEAGKP